MHREHRKRMRGKYAKGHYFEDHELLEMLLFYSIPRVNTNETAHELINTAGSLGGLLCASDRTILSVDGIGENSLVLIHIVRDIMRRCLLERCDTGALLSDSEGMRKYLSALFFGFTNETAYVLMFNKAQRFIGSDVVARGTFSEVYLDAAEAIARAARQKTVYVVIAHNHPGGIAAVSESDRFAAMNLAEQFRSSGIEVIANYIVAEETCVKF